MISVDTDLRAALEFASRSCHCESYYHYQCSRCREFAEGKAPKALQAGVDLGLITWAGYGGPHLTEAGRSVLAQVKKKEAEPLSDRELKQLYEARICPVCRKPIEGISIDGICSDRCVARWDGYNRVVK